uniref:Uncharacterized protein n=1 Tax=Pararge aegeria TaxID=116150 RepID=S4PAH4_9NEOP
MPAEIVIYVHKRKARFSTIQYSLRIKPLFITWQQLNITFQPLIDKHTSNLFSSISIFTKPMVCSFNYRYKGTGAQCGHDL